MPLPIPVSVILPTHNRAALLPRAVESVLAQSHRDLELVIVDDASTDDTPRVLERYRADPRVRIVRAERNLGGAGARNLGISEAGAPLIAFQDSDDYWLPTKLERQMAALAAEPDAGLCYGMAIFYRRHKSAAFPKDAYLLPRDEFDKLSGDMSLEVLKANPASTQTILVRRDVLERAGLFDPSFRRYQDWDLVIRLAQLTRFVFVEEPLVLVYDTPGNISSVKENDARFRGEILRKHADLFAAVPEIRSRQNYIAGRICQQLGEREAARRHLKEAFACRSRPLTLALLMSEYLSAWKRAGSDRRTTCVGASAERSL